MPSKEEHIASYLVKIARKNNVQELLRTNAATAGLESAEPPSKEFLAMHASATTGMQEILRGHIPSPEQSAGIEAIILPKIRPVLDVINGDFHTDHPLWQKLNNDQAIRGRLQKALPSIGRIELPGNSDYPYGGTGFVVGGNLIMTNRHVAEIFSSGLGTQKLAFKPGLRAGIDFLHELDGPAGTTFIVKRIVLIHPYWDMALLAVEDLPANVTPLWLSLRDIPEDPMIEVAAIGYPAFDYRNDTTEQNDLFRSVFGVKRLQPGTLGGRQNTESFGKMVPALRHNCSTLGGNSGSALVDLEDGKVIALHFGGRYHDINYGVPACELSRDGRVVDAGVKFVPPPPGGEPPWEKWWDSVDEYVVNESDSANSTAAPRRQQTADAAIQTNPLPEGGLQFVVPLVVTVRLGGGEKQMKLATGAEATGPDTEAMVAPWHDKGYAYRHGYKAQFIDNDISIPMPEPANPGVVAKTKNGGGVLHYQNFSIVMHAKRRLALFTASNVTAEAKLKRPEVGRDYSRKGLSGLGKNDQETVVS